MSPFITTHILDPTHLSTSSGGGVTKVISATGKNKTLDVGKGEGKAPSGSKVDAAEVVADILFGVCGMEKQSRSRYLGNLPSTLVVE